MSVFTSLLRDCVAIVFPYRAHLESEIVYLKAQLAQKQRQLDVIHEKIHAVALTPKNPRMQPAPVTPKVRGWDDYRAMRRNEPKDEESVVQEGATVLSGEPAGSERSRQ